MPIKIKAGTMVQVPNIERDIFTITEDGYFTTDKEREKYKKICEAKEYNKRLKNFTNKHGGFTFLNAKENILQTMNPATVGRLAYLSTYRAYEDQLLVYDDEPMLKSDLSIVLKLSRPSTNKFYNDCISAGLLEDRGKDGLYLITDLFFKGYSKDRERTKLFRTTIQQIYKKLPAKNHEYLGYIAQLVPWVNFEWNIVCENPQETDKDKIISLSFRDICKKLGYDENNSDRLKKALTKPIFVWNHSKQSLCGFMVANTEYGRQSSMVVNPHILFAGKNIQNVGLLEISFAANRERGTTKTGNIKS